MGSIVSGIGSINTSDGTNKLVAIKGAAAFILGTGTKHSPQTVVDDSSIGTISWSGPESAKKHDNESATADVLASGISHYLKATNFAFAIPSTATINGILVEVLRTEGDAATANIFDNAVRIVKGGVIGTHDKSKLTEWDFPTRPGDPFLEDDEYTSYGGSTDLWGTTWTPTDINASTFGVAISAKGVGGTGTSQAQIDHIRITVYYTVASGNRWEKQEQHGAGFTEGTKPQFQAFLDKLYLVNRSDHNRYLYNNEWFGDDPTNVGFRVDTIGSPKASDIIEFKTRLYLADIILPTISQAERSWIWHSDLPTNNRLTWGYDAGTDLATTASSKVVTSSSGQFRYRNIKVGDPLTILNGANVGEYIVASVDSNTQLTLVETISNNGSGQTYWVGGNYLNYKTNDSDYIRALGENSGKLLAFKRDHLGRTDGLSEIVDVKSAPGTTSIDSVINLNEYTYYYHPLAGILRYDGVNSKTISNPIWDYMEGISSDNFTEIVGWSEAERYIKFALGDVTNNDRDISRPDCVAVLDTLDNQWSFESKGFKPTCKTTFVESNEINTYVGGDDGNVYQIDTGNSWDGSDMPFDDSFGPIFPISPEVDVTFTRVLAFADPSLGLRLRYKLYYKRNELLDGVRTIDTKWNELISSKESFGGNQLVELRFPEKTRACGVEFLIEESGQTVPFLWERLTVFWKNAAIV